MLDGYKTKIGGVGSILTGLSAVAAGLASTPVDFHLIWGGVVGVVGGFVALGIGGKLQKLINAVSGK